MTAASGLLSKLRHRPDGPGLCPKLEAWIRERYEQANPSDKFEDLKRRAAFSRQDARLLMDWVRAARRMVNLVQEECR